MKLGGWGGMWHVSRMRETRIQDILVAKRERKMRFERRRHGWKYNIKTNFKGMGWEGME